MTDRPQIPDSISAAQLSALLSGRNALPISPHIPSLSFGGETGGACDLQFVVSQLIYASGGVNVVQVLCAAMHLLHELDESFAGQLHLLDLQHAPYDTASDDERAMVARYVQRNRRGLASSLLHLETVMASLMPPFASHRIAELRNSGTPPSDLSDLRSRLLISSELLEQLALSREAVTDFLNSCKTVDPTP